MGRQAAGRPRRRRGRGGAARRFGPAHATGRSSTTSPVPSAASGGGTTTRRSAASWPTSTPTASGCSPSSPTPTCSSRPRRRACSMPPASAGRRVSAANPKLVMVSITPFGQSSPRSHEPVTDLTVMAEAGPAWSCGYDDHELPPVRGGGNQGVPHRVQLGGHVACSIALLHREETGEGQHIDVSMHAASNVTTEMATYGYLATRRRGAAPDRPPRRADPHRAHPGALPRRPLRHHRPAAALAGRLRQRARPARPPRPARRVPAVGPARAGRRARAG